MNFIRNTLLTYNLLFPCSTELSTGYQRQDIILICTAKEQKFHTLNCEWVFFLKKTPAGKKKKKISLEGLDNLWLYQLPYTMHIMIQFCHLD